MRTAIYVYVYIKGMYLCAWICLCVHILYIDAIIICYVYIHMYIDAETCRVGS